MPPKSSLPSTAEELTDSWGRRNRKLADRQCPHCGKTFRPPKSSSRYCSRPCTWANNGGGNKKDESWWVNSKGYVEGRVWVEGEQRRVRRHRFVAEQSIGRTLKPDEDVHHEDEQKTNNNANNLAVMPHGEHSRLHNAKRVYKRGYKLNLTPEERAARAERMRRMRAAQKY